MKKKAVKDSGFGLCRYPERRCRLPWPWRRRSPVPLGKNDAAAKAFSGGIRLFVTAFGALHVDSIMLLGFCRRCRVTIGRIAFSLNAFDFFPKAG
jgi:hypothetical protein